MGLSEIIESLKTGYVGNKNYSIYNNAIAICRGLFQQPYEKLTLENMRELTSAYEVFRSSFGRGQNELLDRWEKETDGSPEKCRLEDEHSNRLHTYKAIKKQVGIFIYRFVCLNSPMIEKLSPEEMHEVLSMAKHDRLFFDDVQMVRMFKAIHTSENAYL